MSQLSEIQNEILRRFKQPQEPGGYVNPTQPVASSALPQPIDAPTGGTTLPQPINAPTAGVAMARSPYARPSDVATTIDTSSLGPPPPVPTAASMTPSVNPQTGEPHKEAYFTPTNPNASIEYRDAMERWKPTKHRSVGQVVKEGILGAANAINQTGNPWAGLGGLGAGVGSGIVQPNTINRAYKLNRADQDVAHHLGEAKEQAQVASMGQVPVTLANGTTVYTSKAKAADLINRQQGVSQTQQKIDEAAEQNEAHRARWAHMDVHTATADVIKKWNSGMLTDPRDRQAAAEVLGMQGELKEKFIRGEIRDGLDESGKFVEINRQTGAVTNTGQKSYETTKEAGRNTRQTKALAMQASAIAATNSRDAANRGDRQMARQLDRVSKAAKIHGDLLAGKEMQNSKDATEKERGRVIEAQARKSLAGFNDVYDIDAGGNVAPKQGTGVYQGKSISRSKIGDAAKAMKMSPEAYEQLITSEGATIREDR